MTTMTIITAGEAGLALDSEPAGRRRHGRRRLSYVHGHGAREAELSLAQRSLAGDLPVLSNDSRLDHFSICRTW
jgi:hypothetical protein